MANTTSSTPSSPKFKVGDKVKCINAKNSWLVTSNKYTVTDVYANSIYVNCTPFMWNNNRFELDPNPYSIYRRR